MIIYIIIYINIIIIIVNQVDLLPDRVFVLWVKRLCANVPKPLK